MYDSTFDKIRELLDYVQAKHEGDEEAYLDIRDRFTAIPASVRLAYTLDEDTVVSPVLRCKYAILRATVHALFGE